MCVCVCVCVCFLGGGYVLHEKIKTPTDNATGNTCFITGYGLNERFAKSKCKQSA